MENTYPSQLLEKAVCEFSKLPGIGRKTALRLMIQSVIPCGLCSTCCVAQKMR